jgi:hypothetical protein
LIACRTEPDEQRSPYSTARDVEVVHEDDNDIRTAESRLDIAMSTSANAQTPHGEINLRRPHILTIGRPDNGKVGRVLRP